jgi:hypothetical protein
MATKHSPAAFWVLAETSQGLGNVPMHIPVYYWLEAFPSKLDAIRGSHYTKISSAVLFEGDFGEWVRETQGEEFEAEWKRYLTKYERRHKSALEKLKQGAGEDEVPMSVVEVESPVELFYTRILTSGRMPVVRQALRDFLLEHAEDVDESSVKALSDQDLTKAVQDCIEQHNECEAAG